jgi:phosphatidate cytidylyltransferase
MIRVIYFIILSYFILGAVGFFFINRKKGADEKRKSWIKYITYAIIIHILFFSIVINPFVFRVLAVFITGVGFYELFRLLQKSGRTALRFFLFSMVVYVLLSFGFLLFSGLDKGLILFSFLILSVFDSFSQITGQLWGRRKIFPKISPQKTWEGAIGGGLVAVISALLFDFLIDRPGLRAVQLAAGIVVFAFAGDVLASYYKRKYNVKDFSSLIPGHGGFLDRFDSLIAGGAWVACNELFLNL